MMPRAWAEKWPQRLALELAVTPGRGEAMLRVVVAMTLVIVCSLALRIPMLALSLLMVFFVGQENTVLTRLTGLVIVVGSSLSIALALLLLKFAMGEPLLRIMGSCVIAFLGVYFMRISKLGIVGFGAALAAVYVQSLIDIYDSPEQLTRLVLWVWVAVNYPTLIAILVNELVFPLRPDQLLKREMSRQLEQVQAQLAARINATKPPSLDAHAVADDLARLHRHFEYAQQSDTSVRRHRERYLGRVLVVDRLYIAATNLALIPEFPLDASQREVFRALQGRCAALGAAIADDSAYHADGVTNTTEIDPQLAVVVHEISRALNNATECMQEREEAPIGSVELVRSSLLKTDAWSNPMYARFALRTVLATMFCYVLYTGMQWPGLHTVMLTCIIIALPSLGTMTHKGINRVIGCALGSLAALICTVFIIPGLDGIVGLLCVALPVIGCGAWIAAGSSRIAYVGHQFVFAFALAEFGLFGPTTDVTEIRDRMLGILLGVGISVLAARLVWPEREEDNWRTGFRELRENLAKMLRAPPATFPDLRRGGLNLLAHRRELLVGVYFESRGNLAQSSTFSQFLEALSKAQDLFFSIVLFRALEANDPPSIARHFSDALNHLGDALETLTLPVETDSAFNALSATRLEEAFPAGTMNRDVAGGAWHLALTLRCQTQALIRIATEAKA